jgi:hypothetical protein
MSGKARREFKVGDRVKYNKKGMSGPLSPTNKPHTVFPSRLGEVTGIFIKEDSKGYKRKWIQVLWDGAVRSSDHASQRLVFENEEC